MHIIHITKQLNIFTIDTSKLYLHPSSDEIYKSRSIIYLDYKLFIFSLLITSFLGHYLITLTVSSISSNITSNCIKLSIPDEWGSSSWSNPASALLCLIPFSPIVKSSLKIFFLFRLRTLSALIGT